MKINLVRILSLLCLVTAFSIQSPAQERSISTDWSIERVKEMSKSIKFGPGGTIVVAGAPEGSVAIKGWNKNEVQIDATIKVYANNETDAARLANVTGFYVEEGITSLRIYSVGVNDKKYLKKVDKKFPKILKKNRFSVNYVIRVPLFSDLQVDGGKGDFDLSGVEGSIRVNYLDSKTTLNLIGGSVRVIVARGTVECTIGTRSWRGRNAEIQIASGDLNLHLPKRLNANLEAHILRTGKINDFYKTLEPNPRTVPSDTSISARAGNGGARLAFTVGDGSLNIYDLEKSSK